jgi:hypothetical protein
MNGFSRACGAIAANPAQERAAERRMASLAFTAATIPLEALLMAPG